MTVEPKEKSDVLVSQLNNLKAFLQDHHDKLRTLTSQKSENESVKKEFDSLEEESAVWKLTGPLLVRQDRADAYANVEKRLEFITAELVKVEESIKNCETEFEDKRQELVNLQSIEQPVQKTA